MQPADVGCSTMPESLASGDVVWCEPAGVERVTPDEEAYAVPR